MDPQLVVHLLGPACWGFTGADPLTGPLQLASGKFHDKRGCSPRVALVDFVISYFYFTIIGML